MSKATPSKLFGDFESQSKQAWIDQATQDLQGADLNKKLSWSIEEHLTVDPYYAAEDLAELKDLVGQQNLLANLLSSPTAPREWESREYLLVNNVQDTNVMALEALNQGATGVLFDLTEMGLPDLNFLLKDIMPAYCGLSFRTNNSAYAIMKRYREWLEEQKVPLDAVHGQLGYDPISRWMVTGAVDDSCYSQAHDVLELALDLPHFRPLMVSGKPVKNAGGSIAQEVGTILALATTYLDKLTDQKMEAAAILQHFVIETAVGGSFFPEIAKHRAIRYGIARLAEAYGINDFSSSEVYLSCHSALWNKTIFDPHVNMLRNTTEAMAAVLGGANAVTILPHDYVSRAPDGFSRRIARNISNILKEESYLDKVGDPAAGSYYIETLTQSYIEAGWAFFQEIEMHGGILEAFKAGWFQKQIGAHRQRQERDILARKKKIVGVNDFPNAKEKIDPDALKATHEAPTQGDYPLLPRTRASQAFEALRLDTERYVKRHGNGLRPKVFLALVGDKVMRKARATFSAGFFGVAGFHIMEEAMFDTWHEAAERAASSDAHLVVLCGSDKDYADFGEGFAELFHSKASKKTLVLAGSPQSCLESLSNAGFDFFISANANAVEMLRSFQKRLQII